jgi:hypothetical protein
MPTIVVPFRGGCPHRERAWEFIRARYAERHPDWALRTGDGGGSPGGTDSKALETLPWIKSECVMPEIEAADDGVVVMADSDLWTDGLESAVRAVTAGVAEWAVPHKMVYRLTEEATAAYLNGEDVRGPLERRVYEGVWGGGIVVAHQQTFLDVPLDPRFVGYGEEDAAHGLALTALKGQGWRGTADLIHLYHPPQPRLSDRRGSVEGWALYQRYANARWFRSPPMEELIEEVR